jgi:hypothetical protein
MHCTVYMPYSEIQEPSTFGEPPISFFLLHSFGVSLPTALIKFVMLHFMVTINTSLKSCHMHSRKRHVCICWCGFSKSETHNEGNIL